MNKEDSLLELEILSAIYQSFCQNKLMYLFKTNDFSNYDDRNKEYMDYISEYGIDNPEFCIDITRYENDENIYECIIDEIKSFKEENGNIHKIYLSFDLNDYPIDFLFDLISKKFEDYSINEIIDMIDKIDGFTYGISIY